MWYKDFTLPFQASSGHDFGQLRNSLGLGLETDGHKLGGLIRLGFTSKINCQPLQDQNMDVSFVISELSMSISLTVALHEPYSLLAVGCRHVQQVGVQFGSFLTYLNASHKLSKISQIPLTQKQCCQGIQQSRSAAGS